MSILLIIFITLIVIYLLGTAYEHYKLSRVVHVKTGKKLPSNHIFDQLRMILPKNKPNHVALLERVKHDGPIFGSFLTTVLNIIIADPEIAKQALLNSKAIHKVGIPMNIHLARLLGQENVLFSNGDSWKNQRSIMNPAFVSYRNSSNLKTA